MDKLLIRGGRRLNGEVTISGAKNAALPELCAALLTAEPVRLANVPRLQDVNTMLRLLRSMGVAVEGDGRHFFATIVSPEFEGLLRVRRHQRVYEALGERMREQIHALSMKTLTPAEFAAEGGGH